MSGAMDGITPSRDVSSASLSPLPPSLPFSSSRLIRYSGEQFTAARCIIINSTKAIPIFLVSCLLFSYSLLCGTSWLIKTLRMPIYPAEMRMIDRGQFGRESRGVVELF